MSHIVTIHRLLEIGLTFRKRMQRSHIVTIHRLLEMAAMFADGGIASHIVTIHRLLEIFGVDWIYKLWVSYSHNTSTIRNTKFLIF